MTNNMAYDRTVAGRCPSCASHGVVSRQIGVIVGYADGYEIYEYHTEDVPCGMCDGGTGSRHYNG